MLDHDAEEGELRDGHVLGGAHDIITISYTRHILHGTILVVGTHHMVDLGERVSLAERFLIVINCCFSDAKNELLTQVLDERLPYKDALRRIHWIKVFEILVWSRTNSIQVSRDLWCLLELV